MPRRPSTDSAAPLTDLHPVLQTTLHCMDVRLEDELARYRRARRRSPVQSRWGEGQPITDPGVSAIEAAPPVAETAALAIAPNLAANLQPEPSFTAPLAPEAPSKPFTPPQTEGYPDYLESSEHLLRSLAEDEAELRTESQSAPRLMDTLLTPLGVGSMVLLLLSSVTLGYIMTNPNGLPFTSAKAPANEVGTAASTTPDTTTASNEPSSFYPDLSSEEFRDLNLDTLSTLPEDGTSEASTTPKPPTVNSSSGTSATPRTPTAAPSIAPNTARAAQPSRAASSPSASRPAASSQRANTAPASRPATPSRTASRPAPAASPRPTTRPSVAARPASRPAPAASRPAPSPAASRPAPSRPAPTVAAAPSRPSAYYYVVTDYTGDRSLESARRAVGDAYVRNFEIGAVVQFGAFQEEGRAESLLQDLQQQGIRARIYRAESN
ncbi:MULTISPECIES: hypothetical protein [unclassified Leptolyngbya]|uniref:hypothetical protein n=1 Tax=unclassified Leptolyngbya TaxID=2650499 RepID=UPI001689DC3F|nr:MULTISPECIES: hypothetical protein [unclassified Leptolyngbya]MBD1910210.1 hypothetical protein [Leptolyngbya sp. FACHB-8]MBD2153402.1 hypothetical protein [Leptolyngbya sp. FACHB-16]